MTEPPYHQRTVPCIGTCVKEILDQYEELYTLTPADLEFVAAHRTDANRLGVATQLCFLRHPGRAWTPAEIMPAAMLRFIALQVSRRSGRPGQLMPNGIRPGASMQLK